MGETIPQPEGMSDEQWSLGKALGNVALAGALIDVRDGVRGPDDDRERMQLLAAARKLEDRALKRYVRLQTGIGAKLNDARNEWSGYREIVGTLMNGHD